MNLATEAFGTFKFSFIFVCFYLFVYLQYTGTFRTKSAGSLSTLMNLVADQVLCLL